MTFKASGGMIPSILLLSLMVSTWAATPLHLLQQRTAVEEQSHNHALTMESAEALAFVQDLAEKVAGHNYTLSQSESQAITTIKAFINRMLADIITQRTEDQAEVNGYKNLIKGCADAATTGLGQVNTLKDAVGIARSKHGGCRTSEASVKDDMTLECAAYDSYRKSPPGNDPPACMTSLTSADMSTDDATKKKSMETCLEHIHGWFPPFWDKYVKCRDSGGKLTNKTKECNDDQKDFETDFCQYSLLLTSTCTTQTSCRTINIETRNKGHAAVKVAEAARSTDCEVGNKIKCLLGIFEETNNTKKPAMLTACKALTPSCPTGITYPAIPQPTTCTVESSEPCDGAWLQTEYTSKSWYSKAPTGTCTPCLTPPVVTTTTPAPRPPVDLNGCTEVSDGQYNCPQGQILTIDREYTRPLNVEAEIRSTGRTECITMSLFAADNGKNSEISHEIGGWGTQWRFFPGDNRGQMGSVTSFRKVKLETDDQKEVKYYIDDDLKYTVQSTRHTGKVRFVPGCVGMEIKNIKIWKPPPPPPGYNTPVTYSVIARRPSEYSSQWRLEGIFDEGGSSWIAKDRQGGQYANGGDPDFWFVIDLEARKHIRKLSFINCVTSTNWCSYYRIDDLEVSVSDDGTNFGTPVAITLANQKTSIQDFPADMTGRYVKVFAKTYGSYSVGLSYFKVSGLAA